MRSTIASLSIALAFSILTAGAARAQPTVVATAEGQIGESPGTNAKVIGARFESIRGQAGELLLGGLFSRASGMLALPPAFDFVTDVVHDTPDPVNVAGVGGGFFNEAFKLAPASARSRNAADDGDFVAFSFALDGAMPDTLSVRLVTFDESGSKSIDVEVEQVDTFQSPDPSLSDVAVAIDDQGRATVVYTELEMNVPRVRAARLDGSTGMVLDTPFPIRDGTANVGVALLDPAGDRLIIPSTDFATIRGNVVDFSGATPQVLPDFPISTTPGLVNFNPAVAADPSTGAFVVVWENLVDIPGDPVNVRARRFDAMGNPVGDDFVVNTTTANAQGQPAVAIGPGGESVIVWAGDAANNVAVDKLDVFAQAYDATGQPIGGEIKVNTTTLDNQDRPAVRFLPEPDAQGRPQFTVLWRDVDDNDNPSGTGLSYKCYSIDGLTSPPPPPPPPPPLPSSIFEDGFESGDTSSWSRTQN